MFTPVSTPTFEQSYKKLIKGSQTKENLTKKAIKLMRINPFYPSLKSHKVNTRNFGEKWSSWITGDVRIIWDFDTVKNQVIILLAITQHSGSHREYK